MPAALKDHYQILELHPTASQEEVRKAYRAQARKYHPDVNEGDAYAADRFRAVQEAYEILKEPVLRRQYDEQRWLHGMSTRARDKEVVTARWVLEESRKLNAHMVSVDTFRMSHKALYDYIQLLLSDQHMAALTQSDDEAARSQMVEELLAATKGLKSIYMSPVNELLTAISQDEEQEERIAAQLRYQQLVEKRRALRPYIIALITLLLCYFMYLYSR